MIHARTLIAAGLSLLAVESLVVAPAAAHALPTAPLALAQGPTIQPTQGNLPKLPTEAMTNGKVEVDPGCASEFPQWTDLLKFYDRPNRICVRWLDKSAVEWARWEVYRDVTGPNDVKIASGDVPAATLPNSSAHFQIVLDELLPLHNTGDADQKYFVKVQSKAKASDTATKPSIRATLVHLRKAGEPVKPPGNPYSCPSQPDAYEREVVLDIPRMTVNQTTSTSGDGDRDELYFSIGRLGPGTSSGQKRLPSDDDYYEAHNGHTVGPNGWTNKDQDHVAAPKLWQGKLKHNQVVDLTITAMEQDNSDLKDVKNGLIDAMHAVAAIATAAGGAYGAIVAAAAEAVAGGAQFIPNTTNHDAIAFVAVRLTNKCGNIQTVWTTFESKNISGVGTLSNQFLDVTSHEDFESRLAVVSTNNLFWPDGVDYGAFEYAGTSDEFWWVANGTSSSKYTFLLRERAL
ncbi:MAG: hypothetical protein K1X88_29765 [Nannocystaceae bacterium]|nr:hypothetical protein [Nannocystaceae bacterium]